MSPAVCWRWTAATGWDCDCRTRDRRPGARSEAVPYDSRKAAKFFYLAILASPGGKPASSCDPPQLVGRHSRECEQEQPLGGESPLARSLNLDRHGQLHHRAAIALVTGIGKSGAHPDSRA